MTDIFDAIPQPINDKHATRRVSGAGVGGVGRFVVMPPTAASNSVLGEANRARASIDRWLGQILQIELDHCSFENCDFIPMDCRERDVRADVVADRHVVDAAEHEEVLAVLRESRSASR
jgi:hypothetical protein